MGSILYSKRHKGVIGRNRKTRPKSFKSEELAEKYAKENNLKDYKIETTFYGKIVLKK
ncbi:MAG: hypothetical protein ACOC3X_02655 [Nanoarchaeota archaeon]